MEALNFLKKQHREVEALFKKALAAEEPTERLNLFKQIDRDLRLHSVIEEEIFYPKSSGASKRARSAWKSPKPTKNTAW